MLQNGEYFADALVRAEVPRSVDAGDFTGRGQLRYFALNLGKKARALQDRARELRHRRRPRHRRDHGRRRAHRAARFVERVRPAAVPAPAPQERPKAGGKGDAPLPETKPIVVGAGQDAACW